MIIWPGWMVWPGFFKGEENGTIRFNQHRKGHRGL